MSLFSSPDGERNINRLRPVCYLIHFERPYQAKTGRQEQKAQHYLGWTINLEKRVKLHATSRGARLLAVVNAEGIGWSVVRLWENGSYRLEQKLKGRHNHASLCPICNQRLRGLLPKEPMGKGSVGVFADTENLQGPDASPVLLLLEGQAP